MFNLIRADVFKLRKSAALKWILLVACLSTAVMATLAYLIPQGQLDDRLSGVGFLFSDINIISILGAITASILICGDYDNKTLHHAVAAGASRRAIIGGKMAVYSCAILLTLLPYAVIVSTLLAFGGEFGMGSASIGFLHLLTSGNELTGAGLGKLLAVSLTLALVYIAQLSICLPLALLLKRPVFVVALYNAFNAMTGQLLAFSSADSGFGRIFARTPYGGKYIFSTLETAPGDLLEGIAVSLIYTAAMAGVAWLIFRKAEIK
ncbi:ABC transporter permease [Paenibacillus tepidiphilus]|uniref:ABC transporter permease n=1 Tax=Paenibacillus tepidiphilus TaxID=2608683 RepID=UPI00123BD32F|nr:ABC transporter permease [Paenibacillus tepidiphilus]